MELIENVVEAAIEGGSGDDSERGKSKVPLSVASLLRYHLFITDFDRIELLQGERKKNAAVVAETEDKEEQEDWVQCDQVYTPVTHYVFACHSLCLRLSLTMCSPVTHSVFT